MTPRDSPSASDATSSTHHELVASHNAMAAAAMAALAVIVRAVPTRLAPVAAVVLPTR